MAYSENFPKQKVVRRKPVGDALKSNKHRNTTGRTYFDMGAKNAKHKSRIRKD